MDSRLRENDGCCLCVIVRRWLSVRNVSGDSLVVGIPIARGLLVADLRLHRR
jgi:hypothetical protein